MHNILGDQRSESSTLLEVTIEADIMLASVMTVSNAIFELVLCTVQRDLLVPAKYPLSIDMGVRIPVLNLLQLLS